MKFASDLPYSARGRPSVSAFGGVENPAKRSSTLGASEGLCPVQLCIPGPSI